MTWEVRDKVALVTGASSGIGLETAVGLAQRGARVVMTGRDSRRSQEARTEVVKRSGNDSVELFVADFARLSEVRRLAQEVRARTDRLHILVNNAGLYSRARRITDDGHELTFAVNHLAPFLLTNLLLDLLQAGAPARIVNVASAAHRWSHLDLDDLTMERGYRPREAYGRSKLANVLFTRELARRLTGTGVTANALHPGVVRTGIGRGGWRVFTSPLRWAFLSPHRGARTTLYLASSPEVEGVTGQYFARRRKARPSRAAQDDGVAQELWKASEALVGRTSAPLPGSPSVR